MRPIAVFGAFVASVAVVVAIAATGGATASPRGRVTGLIRLCGGPPPGQCFWQDGTVEVLDYRDHVIASHDSQRARFLFLLPPGTYTLVAKTGGTRGQRSIVIRADEVLHANVVVPVS